VPDQRALLRGRLASAIDGIADVAQQLGPQVTHATAPPLPPPPVESVGRPWTLAAAMEPIPVAAADRGAPTRSTMPLRPPEPPPLLGHHRSRLPLTILGSSLLGILLIAGLVIHVFGGSPASQPPAHAGEQISLTGVRPVATAPAQGGASPTTQISFPAKTSVVDIEVNSGGAAGQGPVQVAVALGQPGQVISENAYVLAQSGDTVVPLTPPGALFAPGDYTVTITYRGELLGSTTFSIR
jgi:hypothetical protein